jgi:3-methyladenine DNA glycosylase AlkC
MIAIKKNPRATKCSNNCIISLITHAAKTLVTILRRWIEKKNEDVLREDQLGF